MASGGGRGGGSSPCGACKFLRRKCERDQCVFAPYFSSEEGAAQFAAIHRVFGASNVSKLLRHVQAPGDRGDAAMTVAYEAQARVGDPIYGCVGYIFALEQTVASLQLQLIQAKAQLVARSWARSGSAWPAEQEVINNALHQPVPCAAVVGSMAMPTPPQSCLDNLAARQEMQYCMLQDAAKAVADAGELQTLAFRMIGN